MHYLHVGHSRREQLYQVVLEITECHRKQKSPLRPAPATAMCTFSAYMQTHRTFSAYMHEDIALHHDRNPNLHRGNNAVSCMKSLVSLVEKLITQAPDDKRQELESLKSEIEAELEQYGARPASDDLRSAINELMRIARTLSDENKRVIAELARIKEREEQTQKAIEERARQERQKRIDDAIATLIAEGKIPAKNEDVVAAWRNLMEHNMDAALQAAKNLPAAAPSAPTAPSTHTTRSASLAQRVREILTPSTN